MGEPPFSNEPGNPRQGGSVAPPGGSGAPRAARSYGQPAPAPAAGQPTPAYAQPGPAYGQPVPTQAQPLPGWPTGIPAPPPASYGKLLAQTMLLVAGALGLFTFGSLVGADLAPTTGRNLWIAGVAMLFAQSFVKELRLGAVGIAWMFALAFTLGLGFGPVLAMYLAFDPDVVAEAALMTLVAVLGTASYGSFTAHDLKAWMRPVSIVLFVAVLASWFLAFAHTSSPPILSAAIGLLSAVAIVIDFNYLRRHATQADVVHLATGIFVSILNIFLSLLRLLND